MNPEERKRILAGKKKAGLFAKSPTRKPNRQSSKKNSEENEEGQQQVPMTWQEQTVSWAKTLLGALAIVMVVNGLLIQSFVVPTESMEGEVLAGDFVFVNRFIYGGSTPQTIPFLNIPLPYLRLPGLRDPEVSDVIVFIFPGNRGESEAQNFEYYLKRCVAVSGDVVETRGGVVYLNGKRETLPENARLPDTEDPQQIRENASKRGLLFPEGSSYTYNDWGPMKVPGEGDVISLKGEAEYRAWRVFIEREGHEVTQVGEIVKIDGEVVDSYTVERDYVFGIGDNRANSADSRAWGFIPVENVVGTPLTVYWSWDPYIDSPPGHRGARSQLPERSLGDKFGNIRWDRIFNGID